MRKPSTTRKEGCNLKNSSGISPPAPRASHLRRLTDQAEDLFKSGQAVSLASARFQIVQQYGFASWPILKAHVESLQLVGPLKQAIDSNDLERIKEMMIRNPELHHAPLGYAKNGPLTWVAECRVPREASSQARLALAAKEMMRVFQKVTPIGYASEFQGPNWLIGPAITAIVERGGTEKVDRRAWLSRP